MIIIMNTACHDHEKSITTLSEAKELIKEQHALIQTLTEKLNWFEEQFSLLKAKYYAKSSENQSVVQGDLFD